MLYVVFAVHIHTYTYQIYIYYNYGNLFNFQLPTEREREGRVCRSVSSLKQLQLSAKGSQREGNIIIIINSSHHIASDLIIFRVSFIVFRQLVCSIYRYRQICIQVYTIEHSKAQVNYAKLRSLLELVKRSISFRLFLVFEFFIFFKRLARH